MIRLGSTVELEFRQPSPVSATARLAIVSRHRLPLAVDGVLLMAETCIVGGTGQAHIPAPALKDPVVLYRQGDALWCRAAGELRGRRPDLRGPRPLDACSRASWATASRSAWNPCGRIRSNRGSAGSRAVRRPAAVTKNRRGRRADELT